MSTQILFIRHGETEWNRSERIQGNLDIPLAPAGLVQAERLAERLAVEAADGLRLDAILSSDLRRAQQTALPAAGRLGLTVQLVPGLRERDYGQFQGFDTGQIAERFPDGYVRWRSRDPEFGPPDGETLRGFYERVVAAVEPIVAAYPGARIACVTHGGVLDCVHRFATGLPLEAPRDYPLLNASINVLEFDGGARPRIVSWADAAHLDGTVADDAVERPRP